MQFTLNGRQVRYADGGKPAGGGKPADGGLPATDAQSVTHAKPVNGDASVDRGSPRRSLRPEARSVSVNGGASVDGGSPATYAKPATDAIPTRIGEPGGGGYGGEKCEPAVVMLHGAGMNRTVWQLQTRYLAHHGYRVAALDLPAHGGTGGPTLKSVEALADWVAKAITELGFGNTHLVGHSMGTYIALETAIRHPSAVRSLVLLGTAATMKVHPDLLLAASTDATNAASLMASWGFSSNAHLGSHPTPGTWQLGAARALVEASPEDVLAVDLNACDKYRGALDAAAATRCAVSVILGSEDKMTPLKAAQELIAAFDPPATVTVLEGVGHMIQVEAPTQARVAIVEALSNAE